MSWRPWHGTGVLHTLSKRGGSCQWSEVTHTTLISGPLRTRAHSESEGGYTLNHRFWAHLQGLMSGLLHTPQVQQRGERTTKMHHARGRTQSRVRSVCQAHCIGRAAPTQRWIGSMESHAMRAAKLVGAERDPPWVGERGRSSAAHRRRRGRRPQLLPHVRHTANISDTMSRTGHRELGAGGTHEVAA